MLALHTLHVAQYGGIIIKIIYTILTLALSVLYITGYVLYAQRETRRRKKMRPALNTKASRC
ncbi:MAG: PepSY domain-containing protein [Mangrovibacterium sp.]